MSDRLIPTLAMAQDPRLRRLFAVCGAAIDSEALDHDDHDALLDVLMDLAPEYVPPDDDDEHRDEWEHLVDREVAP